MLTAHDRSCRGTLRGAAIQESQLTVFLLARSAHAASSPLRGVRTLRSHLQRPWLSVAAKAQHLVRFLCLIVVQDDGNHAPAAHPAGLPHHQLFFHTMKLRRPGPRARGRGRHRGQAPPPPARPSAGQVQLRLFEARRDLTRFNERHDADPANPWLIWARFLACRLGEARGWPPPASVSVSRAG